MIADGSDRGPVALPVFKTGCCLLAGQAGFDSQTLPPLALRVAATRLVARRGRPALWGAPDRARLPSRASKRPIAKAYAPKARRFCLSQTGLRGASRAYASHQRSAISPYAPKARLPEGTPRHGRLGAPRAATAGVPTSAGGVASV